MALALRSSSPRLAQLDRLPTVAHVRTDARKRLLASFNEVRVPAGSVILPAGARVEHLYLVAEGSTTTSSSDGSFVLHESGEPLGLRELLHGTRLEGAIVAVTDVELWTMDKRAFLAACKDVPGFALGILEAAA